MGTGPTVEFVTVVLKGAAVGGVLFKKTVDEKNWNKSTD